MVGARKKPVSPELILAPGDLNPYHQVVVIAKNSFFCAEQCVGAAGFAVVCTANDPESHLIFVTMVTIKSAEVAIPRPGDPRVAGADVSG